MSVIFIAEAGVNHNGDIEIAKKLVDAAAESGADFVKFQSFKADDLVLPSTPKVPYQNRDSDDRQTQLEMLSKLELSKVQHLMLIDYAKQKNIRFLSTAFDFQNIDMLAELGQKIFKVPSGELNNPPYLRYIAKHAEEIILSTGMSSMVEVEYALGILISSGINLNSITVLHCSSAYPTPYNEVNLLAMRTIHNKLGVRVGYSDHTLGIEISLAAVALGASVIEKHFTLDRRMEGPDHKASLEPSELSKLVSGIRNVEVAMGDGHKIPQKSELITRSLARRSIVAKHQIKKGDTIGENEITFMRPEAGVSVSLWDDIVGSIAIQDYSPGDLIIWPK